MPFRRIAEIEGDPFSIDPDSTIYAIRAAMEDHGCLVGAFEYDHTFMDYPEAFEYVHTFMDYPEPHEVYYIDEDISVTRPLHYALISGVGCTVGGRPFLQIQRNGLPPTVHPTPDIKA
ncbi:Protein disulfide isomerase-like [Trifolium repens]|nr:Protein disulfide isomerase-like [Trifolium repens]